ncbi:translation initiation factor IF-2-like [Triticum dicoccoides]|uniref:translation initiation factor IF-2-like n=1 Tax=Triticum dicoccoides TaxID=85692 RepID=UPI000E7890ED|nr:translation initiation factor IF-2-like [Triticum dicoccoides]
MAAKVLQLRSSDGKVLVAPAWDYRPAAAQALPLETRVPSRVLERVLQYWTKHNLAKATGESWESLARWDADFQRRLQEDGLAKEAAAAAQELRRYGVDHGGRPHRHAATAASEVDAPVKAARDNPVRAWCPLVHHLKGVNHGERSPAPAVSSAFRASDIAAAARPGLATTLPAAAGADPVDVRCAIRARGRQMAEDEESACHHRKRPASKAPLCLPATAVAPVKKVSRPVASKARSFVGSTPLPVTAAVPSVKKATPASTLRARRGMGELSCKVPKQIRVTAAAPMKQPIPWVRPVVLRPC